MRRPLPVLPFLLLLLVPLPCVAQTARLGTATAAEIAAGQRIFEAQCAWCHGAGGTGGTGPDLRRATLGHAATDAALVGIVRSGIPGTEMPSLASALTERMAWQTAAYVRSLGRVPAAPIPGNARHGAVLYESSGCNSCHTIDGRGGILGPDLTRIGRLRGAPYLHEALVRPEAAHPRGFVVVRAVTNAGVEVRGIRLNEDVFWIHIRDVRGTVHTLQKSDLSTLERQLDATLMPSYASRLSAADLDDLAAFLAGLRGAR